MKKSIRIILIILACIVALVAAFAAVYAASDETSAVRKLFRTQKTALDIPDNGTTINDMAKQDELDPTEGPNYTIGVPGLTDKEREDILEALIEPIKVDRYDMVSEIVSDPSLTESEKQAYWDDYYRSVEDGTNFYYETVPLIDRAFDLANDTQKAQLEELKANNHGPYDSYKKDIYLIMGALDPATPYLTREKAEEILAGIHPSENMDYSDYEAEVKARFDKYAGAPDYDGGSGIARAYYYTDASHTAMIRIWLGLVEYVDADGNAAKLAAHPENWDYRDLMLGH